jgi:Protein containing tetrapyrrole methyltransferase domain and MazG-like (predicted pyrophosphatase) domain
VFSSLPASLPPLLRAYRINSKAARAGFTWATDADQEAKLDEEWNELQAALSGDDAAAKEEEFGDYLFSLVEYGRRRGIKANSALAVANAKFLRRFEAVEKLARERGLNWTGSP